jgi:16S rRNA G966 N2-methylase RsmD
MRITGGNAARRILKVPKGLNVRPTPDLVKQAVFNSLGARVIGTKVGIVCGQRRVGFGMFESRRGFGDVR